MSANEGNKASLNLDTGGRRRRLFAQPFYIGPPVSEQKRLKATRSGTSVMVDVSIAGKTPRNLADV